MEKEKLEKTVDKIALEVTKHTDAIKNLVTRDEFNEFRDENLTRLDEMTTILRRLDEERLFTFEMVKRIETEVEKQRKEINQIKEVLKIR